MSTPKLFDFVNRDGVLCQWNITTFCAEWNVTNSTARLVYKAHQTNGVRNWDEYHSTTKRRIPVNAIACHFDGFDFDSASALQRYLSDTYAYDVTVQTVINYMRLGISNITDLNSYKANRAYGRDDFIPIVTCNPDNAHLLQSLDLREFRPLDADDYTLQQLQVSDLIVGSLEFTTPDGAKMYRLTSRGASQLQAYREAVRK